MFLQCRKNAKLALLLDAGRREGDRCPDRAAAGHGVAVLTDVGEVGVDPTVLFLAADGQGQNFSLGQFIEIAHGGSRMALMQRNMTIAPGTINTITK
jgi:hypothetical protein